MEKFIGILAQEVDLIEIKTLPFKVKKVSKPKTLWVSNEIRNLESDPEGLFHRKSFVNVDGNIFFNEIEVSDETEIFQAEVYGGYGIGRNAGGGRCGNDSEYQIKGVGRTPLIGITDDVYCSSGIYPLYEAVTEVVNTNILKRVFSGGVVPVLAIVDIGVSKYFSTAEERTEIKQGDMRICLGFRALSTRIGHFLSTRNFELNIERSYTKVDDLKRVKILSNSIKNHFESNELFLEFICHALDKVAKQFATAFIYRIAHGALSPSNIEINGKWLDLTNVTFVPDGLDYRAGPADAPFLSERFVVLSFFEELVYTYEKYIGVSFDFKYLKKYYYECLKSYELDHVCILFGLDETIMEGMFIKEKANLLKLYYKSLASSNSVIKGVPRSKEPVSGPVINMILKLFSLDDDAKVFSPEVNLYQMARFQNEKVSNVSLKNFFKYIVVKALRLQCFMPFLYVGNIYLSSRSLVLSESCDVSKFIENYDGITSFIVGEKDSDSVVLLIDQVDFNVIYDSAGDFFQVTHQGNKVLFLSFGDLCEFIDCLPDSVFQWCYFDFRPHVRNYLRLLSKVF